jgi:hypothetical protein
LRLIIFNRRYPKLREPALARRFMVGSANGTPVPAPRPEGFRLQGYVRAVTADEIGLRDSGSTKGDPHGTGCHAVRAQRGWTSHAGGLGSPVVRSATVCARKTGIRAAERRVILPSPQRGLLALAKSDLRFSVMLLPASRRCATTALTGSGVPWTCGEGASSRP